MGVSSSESHDLTAFYEMLSASFGVLSQNTGFYPSLDRIIEATLGPLNLGPGGGSYNELISRLQHRVPATENRPENVEAESMHVEPKQVHHQLSTTMMSPTKAICDGPRRHNVLLRAKRIIS